MMSSKYHKNKYKLQHPYYESDLQAKIGRWLKDDNMFNHVCEVKVCTGGTLNFNKFEEQQIPSLCMVDEPTLGKYHKLTDLSAGKKPFDYFCLKGVPAYVACQFYKDIQQEIVYFLHINEVMRIKNSGAKALKEQDFMDNGFAINLSKYKK